jgi:hypothetical protein
MSGQVAAMVVVGEAAVIVAVVGWFVSPNIAMLQWKRLMP